MVVPLEMKSLANRGYCCLDNFVVTSDFLLQQIILVIVASPPVLRRLFSLEESLIESTYVHIFSGH